MVTPNQQFLYDISHGVPKNVALARLKQGYYRRSHTRHYIRSSDWRTRGSTIQRNARIVSYLGNRNVPISGKKEVISRTVKPYVRPERVQKQIMRTVESKKVYGPMSRKDYGFEIEQKPVDTTIGKYYTKEAYQGYASSQYQRSVATFENINPEGHYYFGTQYLSGAELKPLYKERVVEPLRKQYVSSFEIKPYQRIKKTEAGFEISTDIGAKQSYEWGKASPVEQAARSFWVGATQWPKTLVDIGFSPLTGESIEDIGRGLGSWETGTREIAKREGIFSLSPYGGIYKEAVASPAMTTIVYPYAGGVALGAGIGAFKATNIGSKVLFKIGKYSMTTGGAAEVGIAGYATYETGMSFAKNPIGTAKGLVGQLPFTIAGYKTGYDFGYGRTREYLYGRKTYGVGTPEYARYRAALKISRRLHYVQPKEIKTLDFAKDIMRMNKRSASEFTGFYKSEGGVIGGSTAAYAQFQGVRKGRDIDYFIQRFIGGTEKKVGYAKSVLPTRSRFGQHVIDIHGKEFYKPGRMIDFGIRSKPPVKGFAIGGEYNIPVRVKYMSAGELTSRKGISVGKIESSYRWFKDIPDFKDYVRSQIYTAKTSINPFTRRSGRIAEEQFSLFLSPERSPMLGKTARFKSFDRLFKPAKGPVRVFEPSESGIAKSYYAYPTSSYPKTYASLGGYDIIRPPMAGGYPKIERISYKPTFYERPVSFTMPKSYITTEQPSGYGGITTSRGLITIKTPIYNPPYAPSFKPPSVPKYPPYRPPPVTIPPSKYPPYKPPTYPPYTPTPPLAPPSTPPKRRYEDDYTKVLKKMMPKIGIDYRFRSWKTPKLEDLLKI